MFIVWVEPIVSVQRAIIELQFPAYLISEMWVTRDSKQLSCTHKLNINISILKTLRQMLNPVVEWQRLRAVTLSCEVLRALSSASSPNRVPRS